MMLQTDSSAPNRLDMVSRERDLKKEKERGSQGRAGHSKMRPRYDLNHFGVFNSLSWGITVMMSFSSTFSFPFLIITTVVLGLLVDACNNFLDADRRSAFLWPSFISASADVGDAAVAVAT